MCLKSFFNRSKSTKLSGNFIKIINSFQVNHHGLSTSASNKDERAVAIVLAPIMIVAHKNASETPLCVSSMVDLFP